MKKPPWQCNLAAVVFYKVEQIFVYLADEPPKM